MSDKAKSGMIGLVASLAYLCFYVGIAIVNREASAAMISISALLLIAGSAIMALEREILDWIDNGRKKKLPIGNVEVEEPKKINFPPNGWTKGAKIRRGLPSQDGIASTYVDYTLQDDGKLRGENYWFLTSYTMNHPSGEHSGEAEIFPMPDDEVIQES